MALFRNEFSRKTFHVKMKRNLSNDDEDVSLKIKIKKTKQKIVFNVTIQFQKGLRKISRSGSSFSKINRTCSFYVVILQRTARRCEKIYHPRIEPLFYSSNLLFGDCISRCHCRRGLLEVPITELGGEGGWGTDC